MVNFQHTHYIEPINNGFIAQEQVTAGKTHFVDVPSMIYNLVTEEVRTALNAVGQVGSAKRYKLVIALQEVVDKNKID